MRRFKLNNLLIIFSISLFFCVISMDDASQINRDYTFSTFNVNSHDFTKSFTDIIKDSKRKIMDNTIQINPDDPGGIKGAINNNYDCIILTEGEYLGENNTDIIIDRNITIKGSKSSGIVINAEGKSGIITINSNGNLTLSSVTLSNGNSETGGGVCNIDGSFTIDSCVFDNNIGRLMGGAIFSRTTKKLNLITNTFFKNNNGNMYGGAFFLLGIIVHPL